MAQIAPPDGMPVLINVLGHPYEISYYDNPSEVDANGELSLNGQIDYNRCKMSIYAKRPIEAVFTTLIHEVVHAVLDALEIRDWDSGDNHAEFTAFCRGLADTLLRNDWVDPSNLEQAFVLTDEGIDALR